MSERGPAALLLALLFLTAPAAAEPSVTILDLPFRAKAMRGPGSEVAVAVATSGLLPLARPKGATADRASAGDEEAPLVVVWGEDGGAALTLAEGQVRATLLGSEAIEGLAAAETPRGALPGTRRALSGPLSAYLTGPTRAAGVSAPSAAGLTIRERQPVAVSADPKPVPVATVTVPAGPDAVFSRERPRTIRIGARTALLTVTRQGAEASSLVLVDRQGEAPGAPWAVIARTPPQPGGPLSIAGVADFSGNGQMQTATVTGANLQLWSYANGAFALAAERMGFAGGDGETALAASFDLDRDGVPDLALPTADRASLAVLGFKGGIAERARAALPGTAGFGVAALGRGEAVRLLVGLADGRVAVIALDGRSR
ncbi:VCBS repeat-containing protein [Methylobacterium durans]|uniref:FG-GAP repeat domain-containing protein n=1 Tax=Methylobacterium durans TaxID=2202825 RepID=UPI002AFDFCAA|nr:VCBS repeat-containing protein [Methylobacterium durans]MEA1835002.1 VCBS repeat-containing protein [Methylobacterium durans]